MQNNNMLIPKGLILYRAQRHQECLPMNIKQGYYCDKISTPQTTPNITQYSNFRLPYQMKFSQDISLKISDSAPRKNEILAILLKFSHVKKCKIEPAYQYIQEKSNKPIIKVFQRVFKVLKRIKKLVIDLSGKPQDRAQASKSLILLNNLESLTLPGFSYSENDKTMTLFMATVKSASKRKSWQNLKSLNIQLQPPNHRTANREYNDLFTKSLRKLMEFMKDLKTCRKIHECSSFELKLSPWAIINPEQANLLVKIAKTASSITNLRDCEASHFSALSELVKYSKHLNRVEVPLHSISQPELDLSVLEKLPNFQELILSDIFLEKKLFTRIKSLKNLAVLSLKFQEMPNEAIDLARVISDLAHLKNLELGFPNRNNFHPPKLKDKVFGKKQKFEKYPPWLPSIFEAISKKPKLEQLSLTFESLDYEKSNRLFRDLCQHLENLTNLSHFKLEIIWAESVRNEELLILCQCLSKLTKIQDLNIKILKESYFDTKTFLKLIDCLIKNAPFLSRLYLNVNKVKMDDKYYKMLLEKINKMKCLDWISLGFEGGVLESDFALRNLAAEIRKRRIGYVDYNNRDERCLVHF